MKKTAWIQMKIEPDLKKKLTAAAERRYGHLKFSLWAIEAMKEKMYRESIREELTIKSSKMTPAIAKKLLGL